MPLTLRKRAFLGAFALSLGVSACGLLGNSGPTPERDRDISLFVKNQNFYDATLHAIGPGEARKRVGTVTGNSDANFTFRWSSMDLRIEIHLLSVGTTVTDQLPVEEGDSLELIITPDLHRRIP